MDFAELKKEILGIIKAFKLGTFKHLETVDNNYLGYYTRTKFSTEQGIFYHLYLNKN